MFNNLLGFLKGKDFLTSVLSDFEAMLVDAESMFAAVKTVLIDGVEDASVRDKIYSVDKKINDLERNIRKRIVEHLALQPSVDVPMCLILMSVVKDAERLGDYAKNLFEVSELMDGTMDKELFKKFFGEADAQIMELAQKTRSAFLGSDEARARELFALERDIVFKSEAALNTLASGDLSANQSVCFTLIARYFKRIAAHLMNIGSSVIVPIDKLDFCDEKVRRNGNADDLGA